MTSTREELLSYDAVAANYKDFILVCACDTIAKGVQRATEAQLVSTQTKIRSSEIARQFYSSRQV
jgi:hypothetical protein